MIKRSPLAHTLLVGTLACLMLAGCSQGGILGPRSTPAPPTRAQRQGGPDVVSAEAVVAPYREADLSFKTSGRVMQVLVSEGDAVTQGQELVRLDARDLEQVVRRAEAALKSAGAELAKAKVGARPEEIAGAEAALATAQADVTAAESTVAVAEGDLAAAQAAAKTAQRSVEIAQGALAGMQASVQNAQANLDKLVAGPTQRDIQIAEKEVERTRNELWSLQRVSEYSEAVLEAQMAALDSATQIAQLQLEMVKAGTRAEDIAMARAQVAEAAAGVQTAQGQLAQAQTRAAQAQTRVQIMEGQVAQTKAQVESAKAQVSQAQAQLATLKAGTRSEDIAVAEAGVASATAALAEARDGLADATLTAPFAGTVGTLLINEGELALSQNPVLILGDLSRWRARTEDLGETDVSRVQVGQEATVTVDALEGRKFKGVVSEVSPIASDRRGDKVYTVKVDLDAGPDAGLRWGMSAFAEVSSRLARVKSPTPGSTPTQSATLTPTWTPTATAKATETATAMPTQTPTAMPTQTPTAMPTQAPASSPSPAAARVQPKPTATRIRQRLPSPTPVIAAPSLVEPAPGVSSSGSVTFRWQPANALPSGASYEVVVWGAGEDPSSARGVDAPTANTSLTVDLYLLQRAGLIEQGDIYWTVILVQTDPYVRLSQPAEATARRLAYQSPGEAGGGSGEPPKPKP